MGVEVAIASAVAIYVMTAPSSIGYEVAIASAAAISKVAISNGHCIIKHIILWNLQQDRNGCLSANSGGSPDRGSGLATYGFAIFKEA